MGKMKTKRKTFKELTSTATHPSELEAWVESASKPELLEVIKSCEPHVQLYRLAEQVLLIRASKPHWTITPGFIAMILATIFAGVVTIPIVQEWLHPVVSAQKVDNGQLPRPNLPALPQSTSTALKPSSPPSPTLAPAQVPRKQTYSTQTPTSTLLETNTNSPGTPDPARP
jgi:hypothetical protein